MAAPRSSPPSWCWPAATTSCCRPRRAALSLSTAGWGAVATKVEATDAGDLAVELTIRNDTGAWSVMEATGPAVLTAGDGSTSSCATVKVGSGGHRLAPGPPGAATRRALKKTPTTEPIRVECAGATAGPGAKLALDYHYVTGEYNYYDPDATRVQGAARGPARRAGGGSRLPDRRPGRGPGPAGRPRDNGDQRRRPAAGGRAPVRRPPRARLGDHEPGEYPASVHIGTPPVIGDDGIIYGYYESSDLASVPLTPAGGTQDGRRAWRSRRARRGSTSCSRWVRERRLFTNYLLDLTGAVVP